MKEPLKYELLLNALNDVIDDESLDLGGRDGGILADVRLMVKDKINPHWQDEFI